MYELKGYAVKKEDVLIRLCATTHLESNRKKEIQEKISPSLDWAYFFKKTRSNLLSPLMYKSFREIEGAQYIIPFQIWQGLEDSYYFTVANNLNCCTQLRELCAALERENIQAIIFKGIALAELIYHDIGLRSGGDVDLLVRKEDLVKVDSLLRELCYSSTYDAAYFSKLQFGHYCDSFMYPSQDKTRLPIDIHCHLSNNRHIPHTLDLSDIWLQAEPVTLRGIHTQTFSRYHQLAYLSMHALNHCFFPLILLCDIREFLQGEAAALNWDEVVEQGHKTGLNKQLYYALYLASEILGAIVPQYVLNRLKPKRISIFERRFLSAVLKAKPVTTGEGWVYLGMNEGLKNRLAFVHRALSWS